MIIWNVFMASKRYHPDAFTCLYYIVLIVEESFVFFSSQALRKTEIANQKVENERLAKEGKSGGSGGHGH